MPGDLIVLASILAGLAYAACFDLGQDWTFVFMPICSAVATVLSVWALILVAGRDLFDVLAVVMVLIGAALPLLIFLAAWLYEAIDRVHEQRDRSSTQRLRRVA